MRSSVIELDHTKTCRSTLFNCTNRQQLATDFAGSPRTVSATLHSTDSSYHSEKVEKCHSSWNQKNAVRKESRCVMQESHGSCSKKTQPHLMFLQSRQSTIACGWHMLHYFTLDMPTKLQRKSSAPYNDLNATRFFLPAAHAYQWKHHIIFCAIYHIDPLHCKRTLAWSLWNSGDLTDSPYRNLEKCNKCWRYLFANP